ncbi:hypothetical protein TNIN_396051 [Trichonephila inaurata madagascariensis]|uniref:Uncharacterized protein n=1 Tax=Trichonephila inaurata madagascariensis TaxID=2747483 RepID=A0A8X6X020_9ARAC|nr:hypothetical protein TNIN_396051 [Trichonephila inaurata madagascariensis]
MDIRKCWRGFRAATAPSFRPSLDPLMSRGTIQVKSIVFSPPAFYLLDGRFPTLSSLWLFNLHNKASDGVEDVRGLRTPQSLGRKGVNLSEDVVTLIPGVLY